ncbi:Gldg family protein [Pseudomonas sp. OST1909]|uniref:Gldg family protein n=1 Tax=Pseudomonas sp. OST1909 TaxID=2777367 RepID=UPI001888B451|nr:Gldg family protein [Pseudomonas sp. OST1909]QOY73634.1 Gldg family protein [Pseudomonas sp. OST1909]
MSFKSVTRTCLRLMVIIAGFVAVNFELAPRLASMRLDLTEQQLYTLSPGSRQIIQAVLEPTDLYFYFSSQAARDLTVMRSYAVRIQALLREYERVSNGRLRVHMIDPAPFSADEARAVELGLQPAPIGKAGAAVFFGLAIVDAQAHHASIGFFALEQQTFLEYDISRTLQKLTRPARPVIGLMSSLPLAGGFDVQSGRTRQPWRIMQEIDNAFEVRELASDVDTIDSALNVLMLVHPKRLPVTTLRAIDQFVLRGGRLLVFVDPYSEQDRGDYYFGIPSKDKSSDLALLFKAWGIKLLPDSVLGDSRYGQFVALAQGAEPVWQPTALGLSPSAMNEQDVITAGIGSLNLTTVGILSALPGATTTLTPLLHSSEQAMPYKTALLNHLEKPDELSKSFKATGERYLIAVRLQGAARSAFLDSPGALTEAQNINVVVVADTDVLSDNLWADVQQQGGRSVTVPWADNAVLVLNALDSLSGSDALISLRSRGHYSRTFTVVEQLQQQARERYRDMRSELQDKLDLVEKRLAALSAEQGRDMPRTAEQQATFDQFSNEKDALDKKMRQVASHLNFQIEQLGVRMRWLNLVSVPLVITCLLLCVAFLRKRAQRQRNI